MHADDASFLRAFEDASLDASAFRHRDHVRLAWLYLRREGEQRATQLMLEGIGRFAAAKGAAGVYHETLTRAWIRLVAAALARDASRDFDSFVEAHPELLDKRRPYAFYTDETLDGAAARVGWVEPDRKPLP